MFSVVKRWQVHLWKKELGPLLQKQFSWARHLLLLMLGESLHEVGTLL